MTWAEPWWLWGLVLPLAFILGELRAREAGRGAIPPGLRRSDGAGGSGRPAPRRRIYGWMAMACLLLALARPQAGYVELPVFKQSRQVMLALDVSKSMLASDVSPSRLERSRLLINALLDELGQEQVGLVLFAGSAFLQCPLSADYEILRELLPEVGPDYLPRGGTNYTEMLQVASEAFKSTGKADRFLIVLSDGESHVPGWEAKARAVAEQGVRVITLGVGTREGGLVPDPEGGFVKNQEGGAVLSRLESGTLEELARLTGGRYVDAARWVDLGALIQATIEQGKAGEVGELAERIPVERFQIPLACAFFFALLRLWREIPVRPRLVRPAAAPARPPAPPPAPRPEPVAAGAAVPPPLPVVLVLLLASSALAQSPPAGGEGSAPSAPDQRLAAAVAVLSAKPELKAEDYRDLAQTTIEAGQSDPPAPASLPKGSIEDALEAVRRGRDQSPGLADWDRMEAILRQMLEPPPEQEPQNQQDQQNQDQGQEKQENQQKNPQDSSSGQNQDQEPSAPDSEKNQPNKDSKPGEGSSSPQSDQEQEPGNPEESDSSPPGENQQDQQPGEGQGADGPPEPLDDPSASMGELSQDKKEPPPAPEPGEQQTVQGSATSGEVPEALQSDASLRALYSRAEQIRNSDNPGLLFQRMQGETEQSPRQGKDW